MEAPTARRRRPNRSAAARRAQAARAEGRAVQRLLEAFAAIAEHSGQRLARLSAALQEAPGNQAKAAGAGAEAARLEAEEDYAAQKAASEEAARLSADWADAERLQGGKEAAREAARLGAEKDYAAQRRRRAWRDRPRWKR